MYADDTILIKSDTYFINLVNVGKTELKLFYDWTLAISLSINVDKTFCIMFGNVQVEAISGSRFVDITLDDKLKVKHHITFIADKYLGLLVSYIRYKVSCLFPV